MMQEMVSDKLVSFINVITDQQML